MTVPPGGSANIGGSFFNLNWTNSSVNLVTGARGTGNPCDLGLAGFAIVGAILCGPANPASGFAYTSSGAWINSGANHNWAMARDRGDGTYELMMYSNRRTVTGGGNDLQERLVLSTVPVPGAVWLRGSAVALLGWARRRYA